MCKTIFVNHSCGHTFKAEVSLCNGRSKSASSRGCLGVCYWIIGSDICRPKTEQRRVPNPCLACRAGHRHLEASVPASRSNRTQGAPVSSSPPMDREAEHTIQIMERVNRGRERDETVKAEARRQRGQGQGSRKPDHGPQSSNLEQGSRQKPSTNNRPRVHDERPSRASHRRTREPIQRSQGRSHLERQTRTTHRQVQEPAVHAQSNRPRESHGFDWNNRFPQSQPTRSGPAHQTHLAVPPTGFSNNAYHAYWDDRRTISPLVADDMDLRKYPNVYIPEHDEYPQQTMQLR